MKSEPMLGKLLLAFVVVLFSAQTAGSGDIAPDTADPRAATVPMRAIHVPRPAPATAPEDRAAEMMRARMEGLSGEERVLAALAAALVLSAGDSRIGKR